MSGKAVQNVMTSERWEDVIPIWQDPGYGERVVPFAESARHRRVAGAIITLAEPVDWSGNGGRDLLLSAWDACYGANVRLFRESGTDPNGVPLLTDTGTLPEISGFITVAPDGNVFHLLSTSRLRRSLRLYVNVGERGHPRFGDPIELPLEADWLHAGEICHVARLVDIDGDGRAELVLGTDYWGDYWPDGKEWNVEGYCPYDAAGRWRGGPLRGHLYVFRNEGTARAPRLGRGKAVAASAVAIEVYGQLAPAFGDFCTAGRQDLIAGSFRDELLYFRRTPDGGFAPGRPVPDEGGQALRLAHCIHLTAAVDWDRDGRLDLVVGAEDGRVWFLRNTGRLQKGAPVFARPQPLYAEKAPPQLGALPVPAIADWTGRGREDVIVGNSAGELLFAPTLGTEAAPALGEVASLDVGGEHVRVAAGPTGSIQGPSEYKFGYTCPAAAHWYDQPRPDLVVSDIFGRYQVMRNLGGHPPRFAAAVELGCGGKKLRTVWRVRPAATRWTAGGALQLVTLDEEGLLSVYDKLSDSEVGNKRPLRYDDGTPIRFTEDFGGGRGRMKLCVCDWTGDGRLDIIFGSHNRASVPPGEGGMPRHTTYQAGVFLLANVGRDAEPRFAPARSFTFRGKPIVLGMHACAPAAVWWRGRALPDLAIGVEDGSLIWFERETLGW